MNKTTMRGSLLLLTAAVIWGVAFVAQSAGMDYMGPFTFNGFRFILGGTVLLPLILVRRHSHKKMSIPQASMKTTMLGGICCGLALCAGSTCQQLGIKYTTVGKAGFITTLYIILVPILGIFLKKRVPAKVWIGAVMAAFGLYLLCMKESFSLSKGDTWVFICAFLFAIHILLVDHFAPMVDGIELSSIQFYTAGIICTILAFILESPSLKDLIAGIGPILYTGVMSSGVGYTCQVVGQKDMNPTVASLIMSLESVVSVIAAFLILGQVMTGRELIGCAIVFNAVILVQLPEKQSKN